MKPTLLSAALLAVPLLSTEQALAQGARHEDEDLGFEPDRIPTPPKARLDPSDLAKRSENPISGTILDVPVQEAVDLGGASRRVTRIEPAVPVKAGDDWFIVTRALVPLVDRQVPGESGRSFGVGDAALSFFATSSIPSKLIFGAGPIGVFPTATEADLGTKKWSLGPAAVALVSSGPWVAGANASQVWSYAGKSDAADVSVLTVQPFAYFNIRGGWAVSTTPLMLHDWNRGSDGWLIPIGADIGKTFVVAKAGVRAVAGMYWNVVRPNDGSEAQVRVQLAMLLPQ